MKILCVILPLALLNVSVAALDGYDKEVIKTNGYIESAGNNLPLIIKNIVLGPYTMHEMAYMLSVPEFPDANIGLLLCSQIKMQTEIRTSTDTRTPEINEGNHNRPTNFTDILPVCLCDDYDEEINLAHFGSQRRIITREATKTLILAEIRGGDKVKKYFQDFSDMCLLIGLFKSINNPYSYIVAAELDETDTCTVTDIHLNEFRYRSIGGVIWEIKPNNDLSRPFVDQL
ncbi:uncharacterized protein LOC126835927 isoform X1 [Adelges cooleyi]|uniref:uncharacterized protein LOC126835927 isoform X1 n=1 Tax=Adelges cooleyi TaxID=133065 RepID=UPI002180395A|nr:uncharacterized protein LOC126835927 isoform X1 [Adelges cooleyi]